MSNFNDRMVAQRRILNTVNNGTFREELFGLSYQAIIRWMISNRLQEDTKIVILLKEASEKLFFLATRSQDQITDEILLAGDDFERLHKMVEQEVNLF